MCEREKKIEIETEIMNSELRNDHHHYQKKSFNVKFNQLKMWLNRIISKWNELKFEKKIHEFDWRSSQEKKNRCQ